MSFRPRMQAATTAVRTLRPLAWRHWDGVVADVWHVRGLGNGHGEYLSPDPRVVVFLDSPGDGMALRTDPGATWHNGVGAFYIPAGVPLWSRLPEGRDYSHLDLHLQAGPLLQRLGGRTGTLDTPQFLAAPERLKSLAGMIAGEVEQPSRGDMLVDGLLSALLADLFAVPAETEAPAQGGLTPAQVARLERHVSGHLAERLEVAELAQLAGLSESWFHRAFKQSLGQTPQRWLMQRRLEAATEMLRGPHKLAEIAAAAGFSDQAHLTRTFRAAHGVPPATWRRQVLHQSGSNGDSPVQAPPLFPS